MTKEMMCELLNTYDHATDKIIRKHLGIALRRAVDLYTNVELPTCGRSCPWMSDEVTAEEIRVGKTVSKITAIKMYRDRTKRNLKESKEAIENCFTLRGLKFYTPPFYNNF